MTPEQERMLQELYEWMQARKVQQLSYPVDDASKAALSVITRIGPGDSNLTDSISIGPGGGSASVPKAYTGKVVLLTDAGPITVPTV